MNIAIIPARGGSKRIKLKNIKEFKKKPIIFWTINKLKQSKIFDLLVLTSDHQNTLILGKKYGCDILLKREKKLSNDKIPTIHVIQDAIKKLKNYIEIDKANVCCVYPCNPLLLIKDLKKGFNLQKKNKSKFIIAVSEYNHPIEKTFSMDKNNKINRNKRNIFSSSKDYKNTFFENGQFCFGYSKQWLKSKNVFQNTLGIKIPSWRVSDIDNIIDWKKAEVIFETLRSNNEI
jgi:CMP-N-acetylneuraminic acid synthetase